MELLDVELSNEPLDIETFSYLSDSDYPVVLLGFQLKNLYDQKRLVFKPQYKTNDIIHFVPQETMMPKFFRGIKLGIKTSVISFVQMLENLSCTSEKDINIFIYKEILNRFNLSCENCYAYLNKGIFPIDSQCLKNISNDDISSEELYSLIDTQKTNAFQGIGYPVIYILTNKNYHKTTSNNFLHTVVKKYYDV